MHNRKRFPAITTILRLAMILGLIGVPSSGWGQASVTIDSQVQDAVEKAVFETRASSITTDIIVSIISSDNVWAFGTVAIKAPLMDGTGPEAFLFLAQNSVNGWKAALEYTHEFSDWVSQATSMNLPEGVKIFTHASSITGEGAAQLSLPWATGDTWKLTGGPHNNESNGSRPFSALDFNISSGQSGQVRAARDGTAYRPCDNFLLVYHDDGWKTGYYHLKDIEVGNGQPVSRGDSLGLTSSQTGCGGSATGPHLHFTLRKNSDRGFQEIIGHDIGGWTVLPTDKQYEGCMQRGTEIKCKPSGSIYNDGTIGNGDAPGPCNDSRNPEGNYDQPSNNQRVAGSVTLKGWAKDDCGVDAVEFTATWPGQGWHVVKRVDTDCSRGQSCSYEHSWNLSNVPTSAIVTLGYDIFDKNGKVSRSPNGTRSILKLGPCSAPGLIDPSENTISENHSFAFRWNGLSDCDLGGGYTLRIRTDSNMNSTAADSTVLDTGVGDTQKQVTIDARWDDRDLYWSVKAANGSNWASPRRLRVTTNRVPTIAFNTANGNPADTIPSRDQNWTFTGTASDPEGRLNRVEFSCSGDSCNAQENIGANGNWSYTRNGLTGENRIRFKACDDKQCTDSRTVTLRIDLAAPTTNAGLSGQRFGDWFNSAVTVNLHADDGATGNARVGVDKIFYRLNGGGWQSGGGQDVAFAVTQDGAHTLDYYAVDKLGNQEATKRLSFKIDATKPTPPSNASELNGVVNDQWQKAVGAPSFQWQPGSDETAGLFQHELYFGDKADGADIQKFVLPNEAATWTPLPAGVRTGAWYLRARTRDKANNVSDWVTLFTFRYDNTPPANPASATHGATIANNTWQRTSSAPNFTWPAASDEGSGIQGYRLYWGSDSNGQANNLSNATTYQAATPLCAANQACIGYLRILSVDNVNNEAAAWGTLFTLKYDGLPPTLDLKVNNGVTYTAQTLVTLNLNGVDEHSGLREMRFSHDGVVWTPWEAYATEKIWQIPAIGRQSWPVYAQVRDAVGNESTVNRQEVYFEVNRQQPQSSSYRLFDSLNSAGVGSHTSTSYQGASTVGQVIDSARTGSDNYRITGGYQAGSQAIPLVIPGHDKFTFINGVFASGVVANTMRSTSYAMVATVGEVGLPNNTTTLNSASYQHQPGFLAAVPAATRVVPTPVPTPGPTPPPEPTPDCEFAVASVNNGALFTNTPAVTLNLCAPRVQQMILSNDGGFADAQWESYARSKPWTITTYGQQVLPRQVYVKYRDEKNVIQTASDDIIYDPTAPSGQLLVNSPIPSQVVAEAANQVQAAGADGSFTVAGLTYLRQVNGVALTQPLPLVAPRQGQANNGVVDLYLIAQDDNSGMAQMQLSENPDFTGASWRSYAGLVEYNPSGDDGIKTLYARFRDSAGNISTATQAGFVLDSQPPLGGMSVVEEIVGPRALTVTLYLQAEDNLSGVEAMRISARASFTDAIWQPVVSNLVWPIYLTAGQSSGSLFVQFRDKIGNVSQSYQADYLVDAQPPIIYAETASSADLTRPLNLYAYDELSTLRDLYLTNDPLFSEGVTRQPYADTVPWTFDERRVVWIKVADSVGNLSEGYPLYAAGIDGPPPPPGEQKLYLPVVRR